jgi:hypothetical protein
MADPLREGGTWHDRWDDADRGLIACWERGRQKALEDPDLAVRAKEGQLMPLPWKGGIESAGQKKRKYGTLSYLAMWQGLRGEDLDIDTETEHTRTCTTTKMTVVFTNDPTKYADT